MNAIALLPALDRFLEAAARVQRQRALAPIERRCEKRMSRAFRAQGKAFVGKLASQKDRFQEARIDWESLLNQACEETFGQFEQPIEVTAQRALLEGASGLLSDVKAGIAFDLKNPRAVTYLRGYAAQRVTGINQATRNDIARIVTTAVDEGWSYNRTAKAIGDQYAEFAVGRPQQHIDSRAHLVAVTEAAEGYEAGNLVAVQAMQDAGLAMEKSWLTVGDARVSAGCQANQAAGWMPAETPFPSGHQRPPRFPGCRCAGLYRRAPGAPEPVVAEPPPAPATPSAPVSQALDLPGGAMGKAADTTLRVIDSVHSDGSLPKIAVKASNTRSWQGQYAFRPNGEPVDIQLSRYGDHPELTAAHETGHFIDHQGIGKAGEFSSIADGLLDEWRQAVRGSQAIQRLGELTGKRLVSLTSPAGATRDYLVDSRYVRYLLDPREVWARSYAQYIAQRGGSALLKRQLADELQSTGVYPTQWSADDFKPIAEAIDRLFRKLGWLP